MRRAILTFATAALVAASAGVAYAESYQGTRGANRYVGASQSDCVELYAGDDPAFGRAGSNKPLGGSDDDKLPGEDGRDTLLGSGGNDALVGGLGEDQLFGASVTTSFTQGRI